MRKRILFFILLILIIGCSKKSTIEKPDAEAGIEKSESIETQELTPEEEIARMEAESYDRALEADDDVDSLGFDEDIDNIESDEDIDRSLIAHWKFDEESGNVAKDSANGHDGIVVGATWKTGKKGNALYFDGVDDYVNLPKDTVGEIGSLTQGTISFWFNFQSILDKQTVMPIFYIGGEEKDADNIFIIEIGHFDERSFDSIKPDPSNKKLYVTWIKENKDPFLCYDSNFNLKENKWHHFAVVVSSDGNTGYLDGVEIKNRHYNFGNSKNPSFFDDIPEKEKLMLGYGRSSHMLSPDFVYYKGALDDFRVYNKPLSASEIKRWVG